jgi:DNA-binding response OmpR family regulator
MSKRILLIDSDESFAQAMSAAMAQSGFTPVTATDSEQGMTLAKEDSPDLIVVCVEAQPTNGYMLCTRLKKDDQLKSIPVILTSASATPDAFEKHKKLKTRAEDYLIKPFEPNTVVEKAANLLGVALGNGATAEEEIVSMEDESIGLGDLVQGDDEPISLSEEDVREAHAALEEPAEEEALVVEEVEEVLVEEPVDESKMAAEEAKPLERVEGNDDELSKFDEAFDGIRPAEPAPLEKPKLRLAPEPALEAIAEEEVEFTGPTDVPAPPKPSSRAAPLDPPVASSDPRKAAAAEPAGELQRVKKELARVKEQLQEKEKQLAELQEHQAELEQQAQQLRDDAARRETAAKALQQRADALSAAAKKFERELTQARDELKAGKAKPSELEQMRAEMDEMREQMNALAGEKELLSDERNELRKQLEEAQTAAARNEERAVKAYQKMKGDEKLRDKTRKALEIALQLLEQEASADPDLLGEKKSA